jgi:short-subunit dehydrogenase
VDALWSELTNAGVAVDVLVNNAGVGLYGELWEQDADELRRMLVLNIEVLIFGGIFSWPPRAGPLLPFRAQFL